ncbi:hypothetical protein SKAU_G00245630 [Synaphobranchus kaupii]|uniref:Uncharacterized protein n=1 Tax=Synaphobranchus kaupii TaxID=118154 RepID=A0A9Q1IR57_SYNKA|nr:hypothetical protein SKAU_G00245630 [Synaphobranchus kaupii]
MAWLCLSSPSGRWQQCTSLALICHITYDVKKKKQFTLAIILRDATQAGKPAFRGHEEEVGRLLTQRDCV